MATNKLREGLAWLAGKQEAYVGTDITYTRGSDSVDLVAVTGRQIFRQQDTARFRVIWSDCDFFVRVDALVLGGSEAVPAEGDQITLGSETYEVQAPGGEPCYRLVDDRQRYQIHTKRAS